MKRFLFATLGVVFAVYAIGQNRPTVSKANRNTVSTAVHVNLDEIKENNMPVNSALRGALAPVESEISKTRYDLQSNAGVSNRFVRFDDGKMAFVHTFGLVETAFADRGTGYNFNNGSTWGAMPAARIEDVRTGWPSYVPNGDGEMVVAHGANGLRLTKRAVRGIGAWTGSDLLGPTTAPKLTWPRAIASGDNNQYLHIIANTYDPYLGQTSGIVYNRSDDGGISWQESNVTLPGTGIDDYFEISADRYAWAANGNTVALLVYSAWTDMFMLKSTDNGETWNKTTIWEHPYPFFDFNTTIADTFYCVDNSAAIAIDANGDAHVVFGINKVSHLEVGTSYSYYPYVDGIGYWKEGMATFSNNPAALNPFGFDGGELVENVNLIGWTQDVDNNGQIDFLDQPLAYRSIGVSTMPTIHVDNNGVVFVGWASTTEGYDNGTINFKHVWMRTSPDFGVTWGEFTDLMGNIFHIFDEGIYPQLAQTSDDKVYLAYNIDSEIGLALDDDHGYVDNKQVIAAIAKDEIVGVSNVAKFSFAVSQNYPNPATTNTFFSVELKKASDLRVVVSNMTGQNVLVINNGKTTAGTHNISLDVTKLQDGVYFYTVYAGTEKVTRKMIVQ
ncbi:MAG: T9SS type A sorting domain-containing protein [Bacteroidales bacterium]|nr:T9SS type A sorting domain-containing protein [Bacteroidales bacterium]